MSRETIGIGVFVQAEYHHNAKANHKRKEELRHDSDSGGTIEEKHIGTLGTLRNLNGCLSTL
eukprot:scaffold4642_cov112-Cylindrotheca_fusiformis.AAC.3